MIPERDAERVGTLVIGGGQAGLSVGYHLKRQGVPFLVVEARDRIGDQWRERWDSLRLFTPARFDSLDGMPFPSSPHYFPTKDEMADYLEAYVRRFDLPVRTGTRVERVARGRDGRFVIDAADQRFEAEQVVVAMADFQEPKVPAFAAELRRDIVQLHSREYRNPGQLQEGDALLVGAGNSGSEIAMELSRAGHGVWMSGRDTGHLPFRIASVSGRLLVPLVLRGFFHRVLTVDTPIGRKMRPKVLHTGGPLIRVLPKDLERAGVRRVGRTAGARDGLPVLDDGRVLDVANVIWCTGFHPGFSWIDLPAFQNGDPAHEKGVARDVPGLYFVGLHFLRAMSSVMIHGVGRDAEFVARQIGRRRASADEVEPRCVPDPLLHV